MKKIKMKELLLLIVFALGVTSCSVQGAATGPENLANIVNGDSENDSKDKKARTQEDLTENLESTGKISGIENNGKINEKNSKEQSEECVFLDSKNKDGINSNASYRNVVIASSGGTATLATASGVAIYGFNKYKQSRESNESSTIINPYVPSGLLPDVPNNNNSSSMSETKKSNLSKIILNDVLWSLFAIFIVPLLLLTIATIIAAVIRGSMGVRSVLLTVKLKKVWYMLEALVAKFWFNRSSSYNGEFSNIPILYWYGNNCAINSSFYTIVAPELFWLYKRISEMDTSDLVERIGNAANNKWWNSLTDEVKKQEAERVKKIAKAFVAFLNFVKEGKKVNGHSDYVMDGKFSLVGKFNKWQFNEEDGSYKAKENEILAVNLPEAGKASLRKEDYKYSGYGLAAIYFGCYKDKNRHLDYPVYFDLLEKALLEEGKESSGIDYKIDRSISGFDYGSFEELILPKEKNKVLVSMCSGKNGGAFTVQPKYKIVNNKLERVCWLVLDCHGRAHKIIKDPSIRALYDYYGFESGDQLILLRYTDPENIINGDDFVKNYYLSENDKNLDNIQMNENLLLQN